MKALKRVILILSVAAEECVGGLGRRERSARGLNFNGL